MKEELKDKMLKKERKKQKGEDILKSIIYLPFQRQWSRMGL